MTILERKWYWSRRGTRRQLWVWLFKSGTMLGALRWWLFGTTPRRECPIGARLRDMPRDNPTCYCPTGRATMLDLRFFGWTLRVELARDWTVRPCSCDKIIWLLCPDSYADEIEEYGLAKLQEEFPGVATREGVMG